MGAAPYTYFGAVLVIKTVDVSDDTVEFVLEAERNVPTVDVYGPSQTRAAAGSLKWSGRIQCVYDYAGGVTKAYRLLQAELTSPTDGGLGCIFKPTGEGAGEEEVTVYVVLGGRTQPNAGGGDIQTYTYPFTVNGQPSIATQTT